MASPFVHPPATAGSEPDRSSTPTDIRDVQSVFLAHYLELVNDQSVMQQLPSGRRLEMKNAFSETSRFSITERITQDYISGPGPLRSALRVFEVRYRLVVARRPQVSSEVRLFDDDMPPVDPRFVGRREPLEQIADALLAPEPKSVTIRGVHGIGKSTLARKAVADPRIEDVYDIAWIACGAISTVKDLEQALARAPQLAAHLRNAMEQRPSTSARIIDPAGRTTQTEAPPKRLLIVLNRLDKLVAACRRFETSLVSLLRKLEQRRVASLQPRLLITLTSGHDLGINSINIDLQPLARDEAKVFFVSFEFTKRWCEAPNLWRFVRRFDGHPLALAVAARAAPKDGDLETYVAILQRQRHAGDDEFDAAIRVLLLGPSLQHPLTRRLLRLVAYWPCPYRCDVQVICAILELPDERAAAHIADAASKLNLISYEWGGKQYTMLQPFKERLCRIDPLPGEELDAVRGFIFGRVFRDPAWSHWLARDECYFDRLDPLFLDAFKSSDHTKVTVALDAMHAIPRHHHPFFLGSRCRLSFRPGHAHQLDLGTLEAACVAATRISDIDRAAALSVALAEAKVTFFNKFDDRMFPHPDLDCEDPWGETDSDLVLGVQTMMREALGTILAQGSDLRALRKCCCLLGWCALTDAANAASPLRPSYLRQAWSYLNIADRQAMSSPPTYLRHGHLPTVPLEHAIDMVQTGLLRFDVCIQCNTPTQAYDEYVTLMAATDAIEEPDSRDIDDIHLLARFYAATSFAVNGHLAQAAQVLDLAIRALPPRYRYEVNIAVVALVIFRHYLPKHKDALYYRQRFGTLRPDYLFSWWAESMDIDIGSYWDAEIEDALARFETEGQADALYRRWRALLFSWGLDSGDSRRRSMESYDIENPHSYGGGTPTPEQCHNLIQYLPFPHYQHSINYHHGYAALLALRDRQFDQAASAFWTLRTTCLSEAALKHATASIQDWREWWADLYESGLVAAFGPEVVTSGWATLFEALSKDCVSQQAWAPTITIGTEASNSALPDWVYADTTPDDADALRPSPSSSRLADLLC